MIIKAFIKFTVWCVMVGVVYYYTKVKKHKPQDDYINSVRFGTTVRNPYEMRRIQQQAKEWCRKMNCWEEIKAWQEYKRQKQAEEAVLELINKQQKKKVEVATKPLSINVDNIEFVQQAAAVLLLSRQQGWGPSVDVFGMNTVVDVLALRRFIMIRKL